MIGFDVELPIVYMSKEVYLYIYRINIAVVDYNLSIIIYRITVLPSFCLFLL